MGIPEYVYVKLVYFLFFYEATIVKIKKFHSEPQTKIPIFQALGVCPGAARKSQLMIFVSLDL